MKTKKTKEKRGGEAVYKLTVSKVIEEVIEYTVTEIKERKENLEGKIKRVGGGIDSLKSRLAELQGELSELTSAEEDINK